jgi:hypothetical protein
MMIAQVLMHDALVEECLGQLSLQKTGPFEVDLCKMEMFEEI